MRCESAIDSHRGGGIEASQDENLTARQQCAVEFDAGVFRGCADEDDRAVLVIGQRTSPTAVRR